MYVVLEARNIYSIRMQQIRSRLLISTSFGRGLAVQNNNNIYTYLSVALVDK